MEMRNRISLSPVALSSEKCSRRASSMATVGGVGSVPLASPTTRSQVRSGSGSAAPSQPGRASSISFTACGVHQRISPCAIGGKQRAAGGVERQAGALRRARIVEMHADAGEQNVEHDRLGDIVDAAGFQPLDDVLGLAQAGHEDHRHMGERGIALHAPRRLEAVHARHDRVHEHHVRRDALGDVERLRALGGDQHGGAELLQRVGEEAQRLRRIVDHQDDVARLDRLSHRRSPRARRCSGGSRRRARGGASRRRRRGCSSSASS